MIHDDDKSTVKAKKDILKSALDNFKLSSEAESANRDAALDDLRFARLGEQWSQDIVDKRLREGRPCMTFNRMPSFIRQVVNDGRQNKPAIKVHPADDVADPQTSDVINGLIRNIEYSSNADVAYDTGLDFAASCGIGYWRVNVDYAHDDAFDMDIVIERVPNPFSIYADHKSTSADSSDWNYCFVVDTISKEEFKHKYKNGKDVDWQSDQYSGMGNDWRVGENIVIAEYWTREEVTRKIIKLSDGRVVDEEWFLAEVPDSEALLGVQGVKNADLLAQQGITQIAERETKSYKVKQYIMNGAEVLEENDWAGRYIPIVPVYGEELNVEGKRYFRSLFRDAKDAQRNFNYWRTTTTELIALSPKTPFIGAVGQFDTDADKWARANTDAVPYIEYDPVNGAPPPQRQPFAGVPAGALQEALNASDDMKSIIGMYDASLGARSNETSGRAINARKAEGDTSTFHFLDNQARAIRHTGRIIIDLIPHVYNKARIVRVMGVDKTPQNVQINQQIPQQDGTNAIYDLTVGKYDLTVDTGPSFQTRREESAYGMTELVRAYPPAAAVIAPRLAKAQDWPDSEEIAKDLEAISPLANQQNPQMQQMQQQLQQMQQQMQQMGQQLQQKDMQLQSIQSDKQLEAQKLQIDQFNAETNRMKVAKEINPVQTGKDIGQDDMSESEKMRFDADVKFALEEQKQKGAIELELVKQRADIAKANTDDMLTADENLNLVPSGNASAIVAALSELSQNMADLKRKASAPKMIIRDEKGRAVGSRIVEDEDDSADD
jgi:hypothetical protein